MTTRRNQQGTVLRYSLAAGRFVPPRRSHQPHNHQPHNHQPHNHTPWQQFTRRLWAEDGSSTAKRDNERNSNNQYHRKRLALAKRTKRALAAGDEHANNHIKGYSSAVLATTALCQRSAHLPYDDYLGRPLIEHALTSLEHAYERFVIADEDSYLNVARYPELMPANRALSGLHSALSFAFQDWVAVMSYDLPHVTSYYWDYMFAKRGGAPIVIAQDASGEFAPLAALYHRSVIMQVAHLLENSQGDVEELLSVCGATVIPWESLEVRFGRQLFTPAVAVGQPPR